MPEEKIKTPRLGQAAKEFNVSNDRIIAILAKNGLEINAPTPNSKLSVEMYQCLQKELAKDKLVKEKSDQILPSKIKKEEAKSDSSEKGREEEPDGHHIIIHTTKLVDAPTVEAPVVHAPDVKIIGSVSPESLVKSSKKSASGTTKEESTKKQKGVKEEATLKDTPANPKELAASEAQEEIPETAAQETTESQQQEEKTEHIETVAHISGPAIIGTMDLEALKPKKKATAKEKKPSKKEKPAKAQAKEEVVEVPEEEVNQEPEVTTPVQEAPEHIKTVVNPLKGPKILGTIDLSLIQNKDNGKKDEHKNGDNQDKKKKKRKRVAKPVKAANIPNVVSKRPKCVSRAIRKRLPRLLK